MNAADGLRRTLDVLRDLYDEIEREVGRLEDHFGKRNEAMRMLLKALRM
jgi:hypothetical protein